MIVARIGAIVGHLDVEILIFLQVNRVFQRHRHAALGVQHLLHADLVVRLLRVSSGSSVGNLWTNLNRIVCHSFVIAVLGDARHSL